ncbi:hypothetical protein V8D89_004710 [Ganoderma adspersum]
MAPRQVFLPPPPPLEIRIGGFVHINHPGVGHPLFSFPAYSGEANPNDPPTTVFGVCHQLALDSCRVVTNHATDNQDDFLARDLEGLIPVPINDVQPLTPGNYYYFLGPPSNPANRNYPIVKNFSAFRFPSQLPGHWYHTRDTPLPVAAEVVSPSDMSSHVVLRDKHCALSGNQSFNQCAHLVPETEEAWFYANKMYLYSLGNMAASINAHTNGISLRDDVRRCFDSNAFVFYPAGHGDAFMAYFIGGRGYPDYTELFHRRLATIHPSVAVEFLYARFAYTVIKLYRLNMVFDSVEDNDEVTKIVENKLLEKPEKQAHGGPDGSEASELEHSRHLTVTRSQTWVCTSPPQESYADGDERWKDQLFRRLPAIASLEEVEHPPDTVACHTETSHMLRLMSKYMRENPQVWQTSSTSEGATRNDVEGFYARWITRPSGS